MKYPTVGKLKRANPAQTEADVKRAVMDRLLAARMGTVKLAQEMEARACLLSLPIGMGSSSLPLYLAPLYP